MPMTPIYKINGEIGAETTITPEWIHAAAVGKQKILLVKALRIMTQMGLKDAKDAVEANCGGANYQDIDPTLTDVFFSQFFKPVPTPDEIAALRREQLDKEDTQAILAGFECVCNNWKVLGFKDKIAGCRAVLLNMKSRLAL